MLVFSFAITVLTIDTISFASLKNCSVCVGSNFLYITTSRKEEADITWGVTQGNFSQVVGLQ
jgi:hypothetical protein